MKINKTLGLVLGSALLLQGCATATVLGIVGGAAVATKVATDPRTVGTQIDDETLEEKVLSAINKDEQIKAEGRVNVVSYNARILLIGQVPNNNLKEQATNLARGVDQAGEVYNELRIAQPISIGQITKDSWITTQIKSKLFVNSNVKSTDVKVITEDGEVFLMGNLTQSQADAAAEVARNVPDVKKVIKVIKYLN
ncbi:osmotically-inducible protein OsmY [Canicola haemoglobinophilus]|uniref:Periplasmic or secreted lipoprotein n=1 Tax=Canicola haemoglobinophilus TaxID=733 RepID=A0A1V4B0P3_9PAST|nr:division/outer membrane stress-associated lipid-binding lipoprotein [Canicola haemoglobinophilus]OOS00084.1 osmotically-inducible protein OsmY [Canicola haemoglobinophilus]STO60818.1 periplasmic or secreted lipoprotein [Canicola haemoglobinophilus]